MKSRMFGYVILLLSMLFVPSIAHAQIQVGLGLGAPVYGRSIPTAGTVDSAGVVHIASTLDSSPQIVVEVHRTFKVAEKLGVGPYLGFAPKIDLGTTSNSGSETPLGAGFGFLVSTNAGQKHRINIGAMWLITAPVLQVDPAWRDGFQAPRTLQGIPQDLRFRRGSVNRLMLTLTVSGIF